jgi:hypothetical protein
MNRIPENQVVDRSRSNELHDQSEGLARGHHCRPGIGFEAHAGNAKRIVIGLNAMAWQVRSLDDGRHICARPKQIFVDAPVNSANVLDLPPPYQIPSCAQASNCSHIMANKHDGPALAGYIPHLSQALFLEGGVADGKNLIDEENFGFEVCGDGEG